MDESVDDGPVNVASEDGAWLRRMVFGGFGCLRMKHFQWCCDGRHNEQSNKFQFFGSRKVFHVYRRS